MKENLTVGGVETHWALDFLTGRTNSASPNSKGEPPQIQKFIKQHKKGLSPSSMMACLKTLLVSC